MNTQQSDNTLDEILHCLDSNPGLQWQVKLGLLKWRDEAVAEAKKTKVEQSESFCGCHMCKFHTDAYAIQPKRDKLRKDK